MNAQSLAGTTAPSAGGAAWSTLAGLQRDFRDWLVLADSAAGARVGPEAGLAVYQNNYRCALMESLKASYPRLLAWLGDTAFEAAAVHYADDHPPHHWTLDAFGERFAETLERLYPADADVADLARLDWALGEAFVAADAAPMAAADLGAVDWDRATIRFVPALRTVPIRSNADIIWLALAGDAEPPAGQALAEPASVLVWRQGFESVMRAAAPVEARMIALAREQRTFAQICEVLAADMGELPAVEAAGQALGRWVAEAMIASIA